MLPIGAALEKCGSCALLHDPSLELARRIPPATLAERTSWHPKDQAKLANALGDVLLKLQQFHRQRQPGVLMRARLSKSLQDGLVALVYHKDFVGEVTLSAAERLTQD